MASQTADVMVVGAGVAGLGVAACLAGERTVVVLEAESTPCFHSTGRSAAVYIESYGPPAVRAATKASAPFFFDTPEGLAEAPLLTPRGMLNIEYEDDAGHLAPLMAENPGVQRITIAEAMGLLPILRPDGVVDVSYEEAALDIDVDLLIGAFRRMARSRDVRTCTNARVASLSRKHGLWRAETPAGAFEAPIVVNAAGGWASEIAALAGALPIEIQPKRRSAAIIPAPAGHDVSRWPLFDDAAERWYAKPTGGKLMVSPADADPVEACDIWPDDMVLAEGVHRFSNAVTFEVTRVERSWAGLRSFSKDGEPVVGFDAAAEGFFWLAGQGGYGIQTAPALSELAAALICGQTPSLGAGPISRLSPDRYV